MKFVLNIVLEKKLPDIHDFFTQLKCFRKLKY